MLDFIINYWIVFVVIAIVLLLGLFGYMMDRKKYDEYRDEIINEGNAANTLSSRANVSEVADVVQVQDNK
ncbi:MAG: hypothetical protein K6C11_04160 [Bacilli bacterium]|nr:hypothetical protein [Bacilli bacterium]